MSRVHPPGDPAPFLNPFGELNAAFGFGGHVVSAGLMNVSIWNGAFVNALVNAAPVAGFVSLHDCGWTAARFTSSCSRHAYGLPFWSTCVFCAAVALARPFTPSQPPYRLSKLWFSS